MVLEDSPPEQIEQSKNMLLMMDPPRHTTLRKETRSVLQGAGHRADSRTASAAICRRILDKGAEMGDVEFVHDLAAMLPSDVFGEIMGIPPEDRAQINRWAEMMTSSTDPDVNPDGYAGGRQRGLDEHGDVRHAVRGARTAARAATISATCCSPPRSTGSR